MKGRPSWFLFIDKHLHKIVYVSRNFFMKTNVLTKILQKKISLLYVSSALSVKSLAHLILHLC
jgi:hypothetical protein